MSADAAFATAPTTPTNALSPMQRYDAMRNFSQKAFRAACYAPWTSMVFDTMGRVRACCVNFDYVLGDVSEQRLDEIWNGERFERFRQAMRDYDFSLGCQTCEWRIQMGGLESSNLRDSSLIPLKYESLSVPELGPYWPQHLEFHLTNRCNLECVMCSGQYSHLIRDRREKLPPLASAYTDVFFEDLRKYLPHMTKAQFLGGEPFLMPECFRIWNMLIDGGHSPDVHITTNGTLYSDKIERIVAELPVSLSVSMDGATAKTFESIRINANFERVWRNALKFRDLRAQTDRGISVNFTLSALNVHELVDMALMLEEEGLWLNIIDLHYPPAMSLFSKDKRELRPVVERLERQAEAVMPRLIKNGSPLRYHISLLRSHVDQAPRGETTTGSAPPPDTILHKISLVTAETDGAAAKRLRQWSGGRPIDEMIVDAQDVVCEVKSDPQSPVARLHCKGQRLFDDVLNLLAAELRGEIVQVRRQSRRDCLDFRYKISGAQESSLRLLAVPLPEETGRPARNRILISLAPRTLFRALGEIEGVRSTPKERLYAALRKWNVQAIVDEFVVDVDDRILIEKGIAPPGATLKELLELRLGPGFFRMAFRNRNGYIEEIYTVSGADSILLLLATTKEDGASAHVFCATAPKTLCRDMWFFNDSSAEADYRNVVGAFNEAVVGEAIVDGEDHVQEVIESTDALPAHALSGKSIGDILKFFSDRRGNANLLREMLECGWVEQLYAMGLGETGAFFRLLAAPIGDAASPRARVLFSLAPQTLGRLLKVVSKGLKIEIDSVRDRLSEWSGGRSVDELDVDGDDVVVLAAPNAAWTRCSPGARLVQGLPPGTLERLGTNSFLSAESIVSEVDRTYVCFGEEETVTLLRIIAVPVDGDPLQRSKLLVSSAPRTLVRQLVELQGQAPPKEDRIREDLLNWSGGRAIGVLEVDVEDFILHADVEAVSELQSAPLVGQTVVRMLESVGRRLDKKAYTLVGRTVGRMLESVGRRLHNRAYRISHEPWNGGAERIYGFSGWRKSARLRILAVPILDELGQTRRARAYFSIRR